MKKIVFVDISMKEKLEAVSYENTGNACCAYKVPVVYPINAVLSEKIKKNDYGIGNLLFANHVLLVFFYLCI